MMFILIDKKTGEKKDNIIIKDGLFINKDNGKILKNIKVFKQPETEKEKIIKINIPIDNEEYELPIKISNLEIRKDKNSKEEKIFNKETGFPIKNIINIKKPENKNVLINKRNNQELNNIIKYKDDKNKKEIFTKIDIIIPLNKDYIELKCEKYTIIGNEILVNKNTSEKLDKIEIKNNKENVEKIFINKY